MYSLPIEPIVIPDEPDVIIIDDDNDDIVEVVEYGCPGPAQASPSNAPFPRALRSTESLTNPEEFEIEIRDSIAKDPCTPPQSLCTDLSSSASHTKESIELSLNAVTIHGRSLSPSSVSPRPSKTIPTSKDFFSPSIRRLGVSTSTALSPSQAIDIQNSDEICEKQRFGIDGFKPVSIRDTMGPGTVIDLDELDDHDDLWNDETDLQILRAVARKTSKPNRQPPKNALPKRNLPITQPCVRLSQYQHKDMVLRPAKTVELVDGDFLAITDIIENPRPMSNHITLRGHRLQRCRSMNGLLEKKLNEVCFFFEVDLDDQRPVDEQSAIEVSLEDVKRLRTLRKTNLAFPHYRHLSLAVFGNPQDAAMEGGLTARWKYSCRYASAEERWNNNPKERALEFLRKEECSKQAGAADEGKRFEWRGETIRGGAYIPELEKDEQKFERNPGKRIISISSGCSQMKPDCIIIDSPMVLSEVLERPSKVKVPSFSSYPASTSRRRKASSSEDSAFQSLRQHSKRVQLCDWQGLKQINRYSDDLDVDRPPCDLETKNWVDMPDEPSSKGPEDAPSRLKQVAAYPPSQQGHSLSIDLCSSDLATPPPTGTIAYSSAFDIACVIRSPGQMLTYGDAFCGAGGATRGAVMAGLRVVWGFDRWNHACSSWRTNFPHAKCYEMWSNEFVRTVRESKSIKSVDAKVDILHLSPPCQYFSPAHSTDGQDDEVNIASLFAVGDVIRVTKPRVVTLEQTFGIIAGRFRKYFNSLIQMFTALGFSLRWSVVNFAQWGLPQRRHRLIIIASCPGEFLPAIPLPTHSDSSSDSNVLPFSTVNNAISQVPNEAPNHDINSVLFLPHKYQTSWDGDSVLPRSMTTSGGQNYHPTGKRDFTLREYAVLQGFPPNHIFSGPGIKRQIGNAVPPCVAKMLFESIKMQLDEHDGILKETETLVVD